MAAPRLYQFEKGTTDATSSPSTVQENVRPSGGRA